MHLFSLLLLSGGGGLGLRHFRVISGLSPACLGGVEEEERLYALLGTMWPSVRSRGGRLCVLLSRLQPTSCLATWACVLCVCAHVSI